MDQNEYIEKKKKDNKFFGLILKGFLVLALAFAGGAGGSYLIYNGLDKVIIEKSVTTSSVSGDGTTLSSADVAAKVVPSVVAITTEQMTTSNFWYGNQVQSGAGSGVVMSEDGYILTAAHVISGADKITVETSDSKKYEAKLVGSYATGDIAVIKIEASGLTPAVFADSDKIVQGETAYAVGNPEGTFSGSITEGIVSAMDREITVSVSDSSSNDSSSNNPFSHMMSYQQTKNVTLNVIQTDAAVSPGNSGGGLFNAAGELIGIVSAKSSDTDSEGLGFAIHSNKALTIAKSLISKGSYSE